MRRRIATAEIEPVQDEFIQIADNNCKKDVNTRRDITRLAFQQADEIETSLLKAINKVKVKRKNSGLYASAWRKFNKEAKIQIET